MPDTIRWYDPDHSEDFEFNNDSRESRRNGIRQRSTRNRGPSGVVAGKASNAPTHTTMFDVDGNGRMNSGKTIESTLEQLRELMNGEAILSNADAGELDLTAGINIEEARMEVTDLPGPALQTLRVTLSRLLKNRNREKVAAV